MPTTTVFSARGGVLDRKIEDLFRMHSHLVYRTAYSVLRNRQDAEDVLQTIFLKLFERALLDWTKNPQAYLYRAAVNASLNLVRSRKKEVLTDDFRSVEDAAPMPDVFPDDAQRSKVVQAIAQLKPSAAEIVILRYAHNYSDAQIAKMLGKSR